MEKLGIDKKEIEVAMRWGALDLITVLPPNELLEKGIDFVREHVMNLIYDFYCAKGNLESFNSKNKWDEFWAYLFHVSDILFDFIFVCIFALSR